MLLGEAGVRMAGVEVEIKPGCLLGEYRVQPEEGLGLDLRNLCLKAGQK